jgi:CxxC motif-containing protein
MKKEFICIVCPRGCHVSVDEDMNITGNQCPRGKTYVENEMTAPTRILTTTVRTIFEDQPRISCKTDNPIPKELIFEAMKVINHIVVDREISIGDILIENILNTNVNIIATKPSRKKE